MNEILMKKKYVMVTGSAGLIGSQAVGFFSDLGFSIIGIDNDMRAYFFGESASTKGSNKALQQSYPGYLHLDMDIRNYAALEGLFKEYGSRLAMIIHTAAQPSHDWAAKEPMTDFTVNANGTLHLLELTRIYCPEATFIFTSTNKVYGDRPNHHPGLIELDSRWECKDAQGKLWAVDETMSIDNTMHSLFGASKVAADILCQEYGKYFNMPIGVFRGGCLTGPNHAGVELHGFLSYLTKCIVHNRPYTIFGYKGKQVRDNIHSYDLVNMFWHFHRNPKPGEVYNAGGGRENATSILEAISTINHLCNAQWDQFTLSEENRKGDHIWYISDLNKFKLHFPSWKIEVPLDEVFKQMVAAELKAN
jgi:CDP-paratose 2-epimerase